MSREVSNARAIHAKCVSKRSEFYKPEFTQRENVTFFLVGRLKFFLIVLNVELHNKIDRHNYFFN